MNKIDKVLFLLMGMSIGVIVFAIFLWIGKLLSNLT